MLCTKALYSTPQLSYVLGCYNILSTTLLALLCSSCTGHSFVFTIVDKGGKKIKPWDLVETD
jgi:hypothetical protein